MRVDVMTLQNDMAEARRKKTRANMSTARRVCLFSTRVVVWLFVFAVWVASFYVIVQVVGEWVPKVCDAAAVWQLPKAYTFMYFMTALACLQRYLLTAPRSCLPHHLLSAPRVPVHNLLTSPRSRVCPHHLLISPRSCVCRITY